MRAIRVFTDFDGTVSAKDVGAMLFNHFSSGGNSDTVRLWIERKITSRECLDRECSYITASRQEMIAAVDSIAIARGFPEFVGFLEAHSVPLHVVSDGLDFYIDAFLKKAGLGHLDVHANCAHFDNGSLRPSFPHYDKGCGFCGTCKGERIRSLRKDGELTIFIGDGFSDRCAIGVADLLFARGDLATLCRQKAIDYLPFEDFFDVAAYLEANLLPIVR